MIAVRSGTTGRYLDALRGSETAAASIGINASRARITRLRWRPRSRASAVACSRSTNASANYDPNFVYFQGLIWVVLVVSLGSRTVEGAIQAAVGFYVFQAVVLNEVVPWLVNHVQPLYHMGQPPQTLAIILFGLGAFTYAKHPEGILEFNKRKSLEAIQRLLDRRSSKGGFTSAPGEPISDREPVALADRVAGGPGIVTACCRRERSRRSSRGSPRSTRVSLDVADQRDRRAHRPERRGQDDVLQLPARAS